jgi:hypothetical protein
MTKIADPKVSGSEYNCKNKYVDHQRSRTFAWPGAGDFGAWRYISVRGPGKE